MENIKGGEQKSASLTQVSMRSLSTTTAKTRFFCNFTADDLEPIHRNQNHDLWESIMKEGFIIGKGNYCAVPYGNQLMVIHNGEQLKVCRTEASARKFIDDHKKGKSVAKLPLN